MAQAYGDTSYSVCLFLPETGFYPYTRALAVFGAALQSQGRHVYITRCTGQMPHCSMMAGSKVPLADTEEAKKRMCPKCTATLDAALRVYGFTPIDFKDISLEPLQAQLDAIATMRAEDLTSVTVNSCPVGRFALYDFGLEAKVAFSPQDTPEWLELYRAHVANTGLAAYYTQVIQHSITPAGFLTFNQYSQCHAVRFTATEHKAWTQSVTHASNYNADASHLWLCHESFHYAWKKHISFWPEGRDLPIPHEKAFECWQDVVFRNQGRGSHIYSAGKSGDVSAMFKSLSLDTKRKIIVAFTSSNDEMLGSKDIAEFWHEELNEQRAFPDQISWLHDLRDWAKGRDDAHVIVRIHPREGKGKNYNHESAHLGQLRAAFSDDEQNFSIIWPEEPVSSYDLLELAHACVIPWTSMGMEAARLGVPVLSWVGNRHYFDDDFIQVGGDYDTYRRRLDALPFFEPSWHSLTRAVRFYHWRTFVMGVDLRETVPIDFEDETIWPQPSKSMEKIMVAMLEGAISPVDYNLEQLTAASGADVLEKEIEANRKGIRLYIDSLFNPPQLRIRVRRPFYIRRLQKIYRYFSLPLPDWLKPLPRPLFIPPQCQDYRLVIAADCSLLEEYRRQSGKDRSVRFLVPEDEWRVWHVSGGSATRRLSPLLIRLARLYASSFT